MAWPHHFFIHQMSMASPILTDALIFMKTKIWLCVTAELVGCFTLISSPCFISFPCLQAWLVVLISPWLQIIYKNKIASITRIFVKSAFGKNVNYVT